MGVLLDLGFLKEGFPSVARCNWQSFLEPSDREKLRVEPFVRDSDSTTGPCRGLAQIGFIFGMAKPYIQSGQHDLLCA